MKKVENINMRFTQTITVKCVGCVHKLMTEARFDVDEDGIVRHQNIRTKDTGWRLGIFRPGILHPARGGVPQPGQKYQKPGLFVACPEHVTAIQKKEGA